MMETAARPSPPSKRFGWLPQHREGPELKNCVMVDGPRNQKIKRSTDQ